MLKPSQDTQLVSVPPSSQHQAARRPFARFVRLALAVSVGLLLFLLLQHNIAVRREGRQAQAMPPAAPLANSTTGIITVQHTASTTHQMVVYGNGRITDRYLTENGRNQIDQNGRNKNATTIAILFDQHARDVVDVGFDNDFHTTTLVTLHDPSDNPCYSEDSSVTYASKTLSYQVTQRTFTTDTLFSDWLKMELTIRNTGETPLTGGRLLFMMDIDVAYRDVADAGGFHESYDRSFVYHVDEYHDAGYAMGVAWLNNENEDVWLEGYCVNGKSYPDTDLEKIEEMTEPCNKVTNGNNNVSWLVAGIPTLQMGEEATLWFGLCAKNGSNQNEALVNLVDCISRITLNCTPPEPRTYVYLPLGLKGSDSSICRPYSYDFSDPSSGWPTLDNENVKMHYCEGEYCIYNRVPELRIVQAPTSPSAQYAVQVNARWVDHEGYEYGLVFGQTRFPVPTYRFGIDPINRKFRLKYHDGENDWQCISDSESCWTFSPYIRSGFGSNRLKAVCNGTGIQLYINDWLVWQGEGPEPCSGHVGLETQALHPPAEAHFDNFLVSCPPGVQVAGNQEAEFKSGATIRLDVDR